MKHKLLQNSASPLDSSNPWGKICSQQEATLNKSLSFLTQSQPSAYLDSNTEIYLNSSHMLLCIYTAYAYGFVPVILVPRKLWYHKQYFVLNFLWELINFLNTIYSWKSWSDDASPVKSMGYSSRFCSQYPYDSLQPLSVISVLEIWHPFLASTDTRHICNAYTNIHDEDVIKSYSISTSFKI